MAKLLACLIHPKPYVGLGYYLYFSPDNAATRFDLVAAAVQHHADDWIGDKQLMDALIEEWTAFFNALGRARKARNDITHGTVREIEVGRAKRPTMRLAPLTHDPHRNTARPGQSFGRSAADVEKVAERLYELKLWARQFQSFAVVYHQEPTSLPDTLAGLKGNRQTYVDRTGDVPTPPTLPAPPLSSGA